MIRLPAGADGTLQGPAPIPYSATAAARQREAIAPVALKPAADYGSNAADLFLASYRDPKAFGPDLVAKSSSNRPSHGPGRPESSDLLAASRESRIPPPLGNRVEESAIRGSEPGRATASVSPGSGDATESPFQQAMIPPPRVPQPVSNDQAQATPEPTPVPPTGEAMIPPPRVTGLSDSPDLQQASRETGIAPPISPSSTTETPASEPVNTAKVEGSELPPTLETPPSQPAPVADAPTLPPATVENANPAEAMPAPSQPATPTEPPDATEPSAPAEPFSAPAAAAELPTPTPEPAESPELPPATAEAPTTATPPTEPAAPVELPPPSGAPVELPLPSPAPTEAPKEPPAEPELPNGPSTAEAGPEPPAPPVELPAPTPPPVEGSTEPPASIELPSAPPVPTAAAPAEPPAAVELPPQTPSATPDPLPPLELSNEAVPDPKTKPATDAFEEASIPPPTPVKPGSEPSADAGDLSQAFEQAKIPPPSPLGTQSPGQPGGKGVDPDSLPPLQLDPEVLGTTLELPAPPPLPTPPPTVAVAEECPACVILRKQKESDHWANGQVRPKVLCPSCQAKESQSGPSTKPGKPNLDLDAALKEAGIAPPQVPATAPPDSQAKP